MKVPIVPLSDRRAFLRSATALAAAPLSGCCWLRAKPGAVCPDSREVSYLDGPLTIDAHCHVFNGTDLQVRDFLAKVAGRQRGALGIGANLIGGILQELAWGIAPRGPAELDTLKDIAQAINACDRPDAANRVKVLRQTAYSNGKQELQAAVRRAPEFRAHLETFAARAAPPAPDSDAAARFDAVAIIESLPDDVEVYHTLRKGGMLRAMSAKGPSVEGMIHFVLQNFQYRYVSVHDYLRTYNEPGARVVDLMLPSIVDYDWWLSKGQPTPTSIAGQVEVMEQISILTGGRVHAFIAFDPLRQVAHDLKYGDVDAFALVADAVERKGCAGVKLYPPMGFAPYGNAQVQADKGPHFWAREWLPDWTDRSDLGALLDGAMLKMLKWCEANEVPVMAHTNLSNGVTNEFEELAGSSHWKAALAVAPNLRVNFGHFGDTSLVEDGTTGLERARGFAALMTARASGMPGTYAYADAGYFVEVMANRPALLDDLRQLYEETAAKADAALGNRFLYGTDWEMTLTEGGIERYLSQFVELFDAMEKRPAIRSTLLRDLSAKFFGGNAVDFLGLRQNGQTRKRLEAFYRKNGVTTPDWKAKVDKLA